MSDKEWDVFISHAHEDKADIARPLCDALRKAGAKVWLDQHELKLGDSLSEKIDEGLSRSRFGVVILSPAFLAKHWPKKELSGLRAKEEDGEKVILPVWHKLDKATLKQVSPILADALAARTEDGVDHVAQQILEVIFARASDSPSAMNPTVVSRLVQLIESRPQKADFIDFLRSYISKEPWQFIWGPQFTLETLRVTNTEFDGYSPDQGHYIGITFFNFTEIWADPYDSKNTHGLEINDKIRQAVSSARDVAAKAKFDPVVQEKILCAALGKPLSPDELARYRQYASSLGLRLEFYIYAGRRRHIDSSTERHDLWSRLLRENGDYIRIKTYDNIIESFFRFS